MKPIFELIKPNKTVFKEFSVWLFAKLGRNKNSFTNFGKFSNKLKIPYLLAFLEYKNVPILEALSYYNCKSSNQATCFEELCLYMIAEEFRRIETNKKIDYVPF